MIAIALNIGVETMRISNPHRLILILVGLSLLACSGDFCEDATKVVGLDSEGFVTRPERQPASTTVLAKTKDRIRVEFPLAPDKLKTVRVWGEDMPAPKPTSGETTETTETTDTTDTTAPAEK